MHIRWPVTYDVGLSAVYVQTAAAASVAASAATDQLRISLELGST